MIGLDRVALVEVVEHLHLATVERDQIGLGSRLLNRLQRLGQLDLLKRLR
jgi:hypothetical protein